MMAIDVDKLKRMASPAGMDFDIGKPAMESCRRSGPPTSTRARSPLTALVFFMSPAAIYDALPRSAQAVNRSTSLEEADNALHAIGVLPELDFERSLETSRVA
jgi:hypothetical protein